MMRLHKCACYLHEFWIDALPSTVKVVATQLIGEWLPMAVLIVIPNVLKRKIIETKRMTTCNGKPKRDR